MIAWQFAFSSINVYYDVNFPVLQSSICMDVRRNKFINFEGKFCFLAWKQSFESSAYYMEPNFFFSAVV
jgi:hypothetical protein